MSYDYPIRSQQPKPLPDPAEVHVGGLDDVVFDALGLTEAERKPAKHRGGQGSLLGGLRVAKPFLGD